MAEPRARLAVLGSPIAHSRSPLLHAAAYRALGLDWHYGAVEATGESLAGFIASRDDSWRGLSLTMPLKRDVLPLLDEVDEVATLTGGANTVLWQRGSRDILRGFNTDVYGVTEAFRTAGVRELRDVLVLGGGATAASVIVAVQQLGAARATVLVRDPDRARGLEALGARAGIAISVRPIGAPDVAGSPDAMGSPDAVVNTIPGHADHGLRFDAALRQHAVLLDVAYDPWPSSLAMAWLEAGGTVISGLEMLIFQALAQIRIFVGGSPDAPLPDDTAVLAAMRSAVA